MYIPLWSQARATNYNPTPAEQEALGRCDEYARMLWRFGVITGGGGGMGVGSAVRVPMVQRVAVGAAFASAGGFYSQYKANLPCLQRLLELDQPASAPASPLAVQARTILRDGGPAAIRRLQGAEAARRAPDLMRPATAVAVSDGATHLTSDHAYGGDDGAMRDREPTPATAPAAPSSSGDSWEAVRQRYQARAAGDDPSAASAAGAMREASSRDVSPRGSLAPIASGGSPTPAGRGRVVRNAYGDEVVVE